MAASADDRRTALLVVDVQNDFADPRGSLRVAGGEEILPLVNREIDAAAAAGTMVVYSQDWHPATTPHFQQDGGPWPVHCVAGSWGAQLHPRLRIAAGAEFIRKGTGGEDGYSAFSLRDPLSGAQAGTGLEELLRRRGIGRVVIVGLATDYCVRETALDAIARGFATRVLRQGVAAVNLQAEDGARALAGLAAVGVEIR
jgi:nicotinamidase/pyrazinamidase